jgi:hypothetical protein
MRQLVIVAAAAAALAIGSRAASADQCAIITDAQATKAKELIKATDGTFLSYCAPCHDKEIKTDHARSLSIRHGKIGPSLWINDKLEDIAYIYYALPDGRFRNLGIAAGCAPESVPEYLRPGKPPT